MNPRLRVPASAVVANILVLSLATGVNGQSLVQSRATIVHVEGEQVSNLATGQVFGWSYVAPALDETGAVVFGARVVGPGSVYSPTDSAFQGSRIANVEVIAENGMPAPGIPGSHYWLDIGFASALGPGVSPNGAAFWSCLHTSASFVLDQFGLFGGHPGDIKLLAREGEPMPSAGPGVLLWPEFVGLSAHVISVNRSGRVLCSGTNGSPLPLAPGIGFFTGLPGALDQVVLPSTAAVSGTVFESTLSHAQINQSGQVLYAAELSTALGASPATTLNNTAVFLWTPVVGNSVIARQGDQVPGLPLGNIFAGLAGSGSTSVDYWDPYVGENTFNRTGDTALALSLRGPNVIPDVNDVAIFVGGGAGLSLTAVRTGSAAPGTSHLFDIILPQSLSLNNSGSIAFYAHLRGSSASTAQGIWAGPPNALSLVARSGDPCPGTQGATLQIVPSVDWGHAPFPVFPLLNERGQVLFPAFTYGGDTTLYNDEALLLYDPIAGLRLVAREGDQLEITPGAFRTISLQYFMILPRNNGDANPLGFNRDGRIAASFRVGGVTSSPQLTVVIDTRTDSREYCFGDGLDSSHLSQCPCGNNGAKGNGCGNSAHPQGAHMRSSGIAARDDMALHTEGTPSTSPVVYFQGTGLQDAVFGDGVVCVGGTLQRLAVVISLAGRSSFPATPQTSSLASAGGVTVGSGVTRRYQAVYRDSTVAFCQAGTFNTTNGVEIDW